MHGALSRRSVFKQLLTAAAVTHLAFPRRLFAADPPKSSPPPAQTVETEYQRPELLAICWLGEQVQGKKSPPPEFAWRPDGTALSKDEITRIYDEASGFDLNLWDPTRSLRPLILVFRIDERSKWKQSIRASASVNGRTVIGGPFNDSRKNHLAVSSISPFLNQLAEWPAEVDIEVRTQIAEPEMILRLDEMPKSKIDVDKGVQWSIEPNLGIRRDGTRGFPATVIWWSREERNPLNDYEPLVTLKNGKQLNRRLVHPDYEISEVIEADNPVTSVEFWRRRYRLDRYEKIPTFLDRMPK